MSPRPHSRWGWLLLAFPVIGLVELSAHLRQVRQAVSEADFVRAREATGALEPDQAFVFLPRWTDPLGREAFADVLGTQPLLAAPTDFEQYQRVIEVSVHGETSPELSSWTTEWEKPAGRLTVRLRENPAFRKVQTALLEAVATPSLVVSQGGAECALQKGTASAGTWSPSTPATRYACKGGAVGLAVIPDLEYRERGCLLVPASSAPTRLAFADVHFGSELRLAYGLHTEGERDRKGAPVTLRILVQTDDGQDGVTDVELGSLTHHDGEGWQTGTVTTPKLEGQVGTLIVELASSGSKRPFCFGGFTR